MTPHPTRAEGEGGDALTDDEFGEALTDLQFTYFNTMGAMERGGDLAHDRLEAHDRAQRAEIARLRNACSKMNEDVSQELGKALGYPWFKDDRKNFPDATAKDGVCVGDHVAESLALEAAREIARLRTRLAAVEAAVDAVLEDYGPAEAWPVMSNMQSMIALRTARHGPTEHKEKP